MDISSINPKDIIFALDIGTRSIIGTVGIVRDKKFCVVAEYTLEHEERAMIDGQIHDISLVANSVNMVKKYLEDKLDVKLENVAIAAAGRFLKTITYKSELKIDNDKEIDKDTVRSLELTAVKCAEEKVNGQAEGKLYCVGYTVKNYYLNGYVIGNLLSHKGESIEAEVIATFLPRSVVDSLYSVMNKVGLQVVSLTLEPIAAMEAAVPQNLRLLNLALVDVGAGTSDIAISSKDTISAYGMVPLAGDEITELIAQQYLIDFNTAERVKKECSTSEKITYVDVLGLENEISSQEIIKLITPTIKKIADEIGSRIIELNGGKSPNAVFLVGGGAYTPMIKELLAEKLNLSIQRIGIKGRDSVSQCVCEDNSMGSIGVTVLGIALVSIKRLGHDFIDVILNGKVISLFNSYKHRIIDVMMQAGIDPKMLVGKNGKSIRFALNGIKRVAFGTLSSGAIIKVNNLQVSIDEEIREGDNIEIIYAVNGKDALPKVIDYIKNVYSIDFFVNDIIENLEPVALINEKRVQLEEKISGGDQVQIIFPETLGQYKEYFANDQYHCKYYLNGEEIAENYRIKNGDRIYRLKQDETQNKNLKGEIVGENLLNKSIINDYETEDIEGTNPYKEAVLDDNNKGESNKEKIEENIEICVNVNGEAVILKGKKEYVFVDIFNYIEFDLSVSKGSLYIHLNDKNAGYYDKLMEGDTIEIGWK